MSPRSRPDLLAIPTGDRVVIARIADISWVKASGNYVCLHFERKTWLMRESLTKMERRLEPHGFARIHRSTLVNVDRVSELCGIGNGDFAVILRDGTSLRLSRNYRPALRNAIGGNSNLESPAWLP